ncbi:MAG: Hypothetical protein BHV28_12700 [Candidatus Tokpelaia hoelldobleri]|uniref:DUF423 domain-containing protein n=1 Tax=Candidatus Tokpelaia hoelldobleri TaxID=1902579 RepID=A0A1U9JVP8_9HYPH|nr:MAG: Hypothetical protein BHV28_12700 [Candidatus Tokpelaia hoelldoblerii]
MTHIANRIFCAAGGLLGACGIAAYAAAAHITQGYYSVLAPILLGNGAVLVALGLSSKQCMVIWIAGFLITFGAILFSSDLICAQIMQFHLFRYAAPLGGIMIILGWLVFTMTAFLPNPAKYNQ